MKDKAINEKVEMMDTRYETKIERIEEKVAEMKNKVANMEEKDVILDYTNSEINRAKQQMSDLMSSKSKELNERIDQLIQDELTHPGDLFGKDEPDPEHNEQADGQLVVDDEDQEPA